jgi:uncharacterized protein (DUF169 family)
MDNSDIADRLVDSLGLDAPPVALAFVDAAPAGCAVDTVPAPSACSFWRRAEQGLFFAPAASHFNCPVGAMVMGFDLPQPVSAELQNLVGMMTACGYIAPDEPGSIPVRAAAGAPAPGGILYGPLADFPIAPDAVLAWLTPAQAMLWSEAAGSSVWGSSAPAIVSGRPACAAIPKSLAESRSALSLGCAGMRTFTGIADRYLLAVQPGSGLAAFAEALAGMRGTNDRMEAFYADRLAAVAG